MAWRISGAESVWKNNEVASCVEGLSWTEKFAGEVVVENFSAPSVPWRINTGSPEGDPTVV